LTRPVELYTEMAWLLARPSSRVVLWHCAMAPRPWGRPRRLGNFYQPFVVTACSVWWVFAAGNN